MIPPNLDKLEGAINSLSQEFNLSRCSAAGVLGMVMLDANIAQEPAPETVRLIENHVLAKCLGDNEYLFRTDPGQKLATDVDLGQELANVITTIARKSREYERRSSGEEWIGSKTLVEAVNDAVYEAMLSLEKRQVS